MEQAMSAWLAEHEAVLTAENDLQLPDYPGQLQAVIQGRAYSPLSRFAVLAISGDDATSFLQGQFSCDVAALAGNGITPGSYSTAKGRMQASFMLIAAAGMYYLVLRKDIAETFRRRLGMFILRAKVRIEDVSANMQPWLQQAAVSGQGCILSCDGQAVVADTGHGIVLHVQPVGSLPAVCADAGLQPVGSMAAELVFIRAGLGWVSQATYEEFVPQMLNLELTGGISFKKGCYPGQEIVARTQYLGKVKRRMYRAQVVGAIDVKEGAAIIAASTGEQIIGRVVNVCRLADATFEVLLVIQTAAWSDQARLLDNPEASLSRLSLPYALPDAE